MTTAQPRITIEALVYYVPIFQAGEAASKKLLTQGAHLELDEIHRLETAIRLRDLVVRRIAELSGPLITRELKKLISNSHLRARDDVYDVLYYAGLGGMKRGLAKFEVSKINVSSTNYLFQWFIAYAKRELHSLEAPFGIPPSRFQAYKKISAVRKRLTEMQNRYATNEEVLEFFQSGQADIKTMNGRLKNKDRPSTANRSITLGVIEEQERFERNMLTVSLLDPQGDYTSEISLSEKPRTLFSETAFGVFVESHPVTEEARAVLMSNLSSPDLTAQQIDLLQVMDAKLQKRLTSYWSALVADVHGPFYRFLKNSSEDDFKEFDILDVISSIENHPKKINSALYKPLFIQGKVPSA